MDELTVSRIDQDLAEVRRLPIEQAAIVLAHQARANIAEMRKRFIELAPIFAEVRDRQLYRYDPSGPFETFRDWLGQPEIDFDEGRATDMINFWRFIVPLCQQRGLDVTELAEQIGPSKLRQLVTLFKKPQEQQQRLIRQGKTPEEAARLAPVPDIERLIGAAQTLSWRDLRELTRPSGHDTAEEEFSFVTEPAEDRSYWHLRTREPLSQEQLERIDKRLGRCLWYDRNGRLRPVRTLSS